MEIPKPSEEDKQFFRSLIPDDPAVEVKPMFGNLGAFVHGNMFAGLFGSSGSMTGPATSSRRSTGRARSGLPSARWAATSACRRHGAARLTSLPTGSAERCPTSGPCPRR